MFFPVLPRVFRSNELLIMYTAGHEDCQSEDDGEASTGVVAGVMGAALTKSAP